MIKLLEDIEVLCSFTDICGEKMQSLAISYGIAKPFCTFWQQIDESGNITAVICKFGSAVTVSIKDCNLGELADFLTFIDFDELVADEKLFAEIGDPNTEIIYAVEKAVNNKSGMRPELTYKDYSAIYQMLLDAKSAAIEIGDFDSWYVDLSHRIRHGGAIAVIYDHGCGIGILSENSIIINGIVVDMGSRNMGYGKEILGHIEGFAKSRSLAFCLDTELEFYKKCGYEIKGIYKLSRKGKKNNA